MIKILTNYIEESQKIKDQIENKQVDKINLDDQLINFVSSMREELNK